MAAINFDQPSKGQVSSTETALNVVNTGRGVGVSGKGGTGVVGKSNNRIGVYGESQTYQGVHGTSTKGAGVYGQSDEWYGVSNQKVAVITGSSSGIGYETALTLARNKFLTYATMRNLAKSDNIKSVANKEKLPIRINQLDVTDDRSVNNAIRTIVSEAGRIDVLVNNAAYGLDGAFEDLSIEEIKDLYETNVFGIVRTTQAVLPAMREQQSGIIVNVSSGAGIFGFPGGSAYVSTKFAIEGLSESIRYELEPFGIKVIVIEPGFIKTNFANSMVIAKKAQNPSSPYSQMMQNVSANSNEMEKNDSPVELVSKVILEAVTSKNPNLRYLVGKDVEIWAANKKTMSDTQFHDTRQSKQKIY